MITLGRNENVDFVKITDLCGNNPLHNAAFGGHVEAINELIKLGANLEAKPNDGSTPLH
ncbi:MAG: ankyrin repeat domain-containing protein [Janthinobacterium lividum]